MGMVWTGDARPLMGQAAREAGLCSSRAAGWVGLAGPLGHSPRWAGTSTAREGRERGAGRQAGKAPLRCRVEGSGDGEIKKHRCYRSPGR